MKRKIARVLASKWFAAPLAAAPLFYMAWICQQAGDVVEEQPPAPSFVPEDGNTSSRGEASDDGGGSFTVTDEEFLEATQAVPDSEAETAAMPESDPLTLAANLNEILTDDTGASAIWFFIITLCLTPLRRLFPRSMIVSALNRHRRLLGLACFFYVCLHFTLYFDDGLQRLGNEWNILYIQAGLAAFAVLFLLSVTSNNWAVCKLGGGRWKTLHRLVYLLIPILFYHKGWAGKGNESQLLETLLWFSPLFVLQVARVSLYFRKSLFSPD